MPARGGVGEVWLGIAGAQVRQGRALARIELPAVLRKLDGAEPSAEWGEEAARADR